VWRLTGEVRGSEFGGENPEHLAKLDEKYYRPFGARLARAPKGKKWYQGRVERSHRTDDEEFFIETYPKNCVAWPPPRQVRTAG